MTMYRNSIAVLLSGLITIASVVPASTWAADAAKKNGEFRYEK